MISNDSHSNPHDGELTYEEAVTVLEAMAAGISASPGKSRPIDSRKDVDGKRTESAMQLEPVMTADVTQGWSKVAYQSVIESLPDAVVVVDRDGFIRLVNHQTEVMFGYLRGEMYGWPIELLVPERFRGAHVRQRTEYLAHPRVRPMGADLELYGRRKNGSEFPVEISLSPIRTESGTLVASTIRDTTQKHQSEALLHEAEQRYRTLVEEIPAVTFMASLDGGEQQLYVSPQIEQLLGFSQTEWLENPVLWYTQLHPDDRERWHKEFALTCSTGKHFLSEYRFMARDGSVVWVHGEAKMVADSHGRPLFLQGVAFDITDRKNAEETLRRANDELEQQVAERTTALAASLREKEDLLKEVHHRVKNNLQLISTMHRAQARAIDDPRITPFFTAMQERLKSIADIHEHLYDTDDLSSIDFGQYIRRLSANLIRTFRPGVKLKLDVEDIFLGIRMAMPCGLIINELLSNSLKYAFPEEPGEICVSLRKEGPDYVLTVRDNGIGLPEDFDIHNTDSLGLEIVAAQVDKLNGSLRLTHSSGTTVEVTFSESVEK